MDNKPPPLDLTNMITLGFTFNLKASYSDIAYGNEVGMVVSYLTTFLKNGYSQQVPFVGIA